MKTICYNCRNFKNKEPHSCRKDVWYNHICTASERESSVCPTTGKPMLCGTNDLGGEYLTEDKYRYCRAINDGQCDKFEDKNHPVASSKHGLDLDGKFGNVLSFFTGKGL